MPDPDICVIGHPHAPSGMGQLARGVIDSLLAAAVPVSVVDFHGFISQGLDERALRAERPGKGLNLFCMNGDEVGAILQKFGELPPAARNIILPAWELPRYPSCWAADLERFDEVWSMSSFSAGSFRAAVRRPVRCFPLAVDPRIRHPYSRRHFGLPDSAFVFFFTFDFTSYAARKNPFAVIEAFSRCLESRPLADAVLCIKAGNGHVDERQAGTLRLAVERLGNRVRLIDRVLSDDEIKSLMVCSDAFVSLHRSEGFGLSLAEAMYFEKPVIATGYSGNLDFMSAETALLVDYDLVEVGPGEYPHFEDQLWADPSVEQAARHMIALLDDTEAGRALGRRAGRAVRDRLHPVRVGLELLAGILDQGPGGGARSG